MAINLSNLNISLDKFNAESSGTYNIGQMKLSSDGKSVYRTNNHKTFTILNRSRRRACRRRRSTRSRRSSASPATRWTR